MALFASDHDDAQLPAAYRTGDYEYQLTWDDYIHRHIGGTDTDADLELGITDATKVPKVLKCPADLIQASIYWGPYGARRSYAMNLAGVMGSPRQRTHASTPVRRGALYRAQ
ncbi:MAG: hypothetical protein ACLQU3_10445 [Limisphaerales bacterium]